MRTYSEQEVADIIALDRRWRDRELDDLAALSGRLAGILTAPGRDAAPSPDAPLRDAFEAREPDEEFEDAAAPRSRDRA